jgi:hypothetical protein
MGALGKSVGFVVPLLASCVMAIAVGPVHGQPVMPLGSGYYVKVASLQCRAEPSLTRLPKNAAVRVVERSGEWWRVNYTSAPLCWAKSGFLTVNASGSSDTVQMGGRIPSTGSTASRPAALSLRPLPLASPASPVSAPRRSAASAASRPRRTDRSAGSGCPCSGSRVCIGPRGGRYCITSGGNKRYGV